MAMSEALSRAQKKYVKEKTKSFSIRFNVDYDEDVIEKLESVKNKQEYIRRLVRADIRREEGTHK